MRLPPGEGESDGPNMTPVSDMVFLLLIFFLCATQFSQEERDLNVILPDVVQAEPTTMPPHEIVVNITRDGQYVIMQDTLTEDQLAALLRQAGEKNPGTQSVLIRGDGDAAWKLGVKVMGLCNLARITDYRVAAVQEK